MKIHLISAREIIDSRGNPTILCEVELKDGTIAEASVPSGASTGSSEVFELRDRDSKRFGGKGVLGAVNDINEMIAPKLYSLDAANQGEIDEKLCEIDGTPNKRKLGGNTILAVSLAVARAQSISQQLELFEYLSLLFHGKKQEKFSLPTPMFNILNGGAHAGNNLDFQETMIVPIGLNTFEEKLRAGVEIYQNLKALLSSKGLPTMLGDEGGFAPNLDSNKEVLKWAALAREKSGYTEKQVRLSLDVAATEFFNKKTGKYQLKADNKNFDSKGMIEYLKKLAQNYKIFSIEDGLAENDTSWSDLTRKLKPTITVGDDLFTTNPEKITAGVDQKLASATIIKPNQIGTLSETFEAIRAAKAGKMRVIISHRSGETEDSFIADLAVAVGAELIKSGAPARSERLAKYNRLTKIEDIINENYS